MSALLENKFVLVVDDDADTRELIRMILTGSGAFTAGAQSVEEALESFRRSPAHVVIADIRMGSSDGYSLLEAIRKYNLEYRGFTPVIAVTGFASPEDRQKAQAAGFSAYVAKPFDPDELITVIERSLRPPTNLAA